MPSSPLPAPASTKTNGGSPAPATTATTDPETERVRARDDLYRRLGVCDRLQEIAESTEDKVLLKEAQELAKRAGSIYDARIARIPLVASTTLARPAHK